MPSDDPIKKEPAIDEVKLEHKYSYVGGHYAYKNSSKGGKRLDPENLKQLILMTRPGHASKVNISLPDQDARAGIYPQHNTIIANAEDMEMADNFINDLELIPSRTMDPYAHLTDIKSLEKSGFEQRICSMTKQRLDKVKAQFSHLSDYAFNQMLDIPAPDKRDFPVWYKALPKNNQILIAFPNKKTKHTIFVQVIQYNAEGMITGIKHCSFGATEPLVINESLIDNFQNYRQIAHIGSKSNSDYINSVERFDDGTVSWIISHKATVGAAALRPDGTIVFIENKLNHATEIAARNLGAENVENGNWGGKFDPEACKPNANVMQEAFKDKVRKQISQIVDGAAIPGLDPIFWVEL